MNIWKLFKKIFGKKECTDPKERIFKTIKGIICPRCNNSLMEYDGMLNMHCKKCGDIIAGSYT